MPQDERPQHDESLLPEDEDLKQMGETTDEDLENLDDEDLFDDEDEDEEEFEYEDEEADRK